jgi:hypothetical protein
MLLSSKTVPPVLLATAAIALGCTGEVSDGADADTSSTHALLVVEQAAPADDVASARSHASVWFLRIADERDLSAATQLVSDQLELPQLGSCVAVGVGEESDVPEMSPVELAFAGDVAMRAGSEATPLTLRFFPDVANLVSGVMYTLRDQDDLTVPFNSLITVSATGTSDFEPVDASASPPPMPAGLAIDGHDLPLMDVEIQRGRPIRLTWTPGGDGDVIFVDVDPVPAVPSERVRCALADTGVGEIPTMAVPETSEMSLAVHRSRDVPLRSDRGDVGMAHFDLSVSTHVRVAAP